MGKQQGAAYDKLDLRPMLHDSIYTELFAQINGTIWLILSTN